jgi:hypothetical protein
MAIQLSTAARNARADALTAQVGNAGKLKIYTGAPPADVGSSEAGTLLSTHTLASPFAPAASGGVLQPTIPADATAVANGTAGHFRVTKSDDTVVAQGTCGTSGADCNLNTTSIVSGGPVHVNSWAWTEGGA